MNGPAVLALQLIDNDIDQLAAIERRLPERAAVQAATTAHRTWQADRAKLVAVLEDAVASIVRSEEASAQIDTKRARLERQLKTVIAPREAEALMHEIATLNDQRGALDDAELEAMEVQAETEAAVAELDGAEPAILAALQDAQAALDAELERIGADRAALLARRAELAATLEPADVTAYAALRERFGGVGVVCLAGRKCTGCNLDLTAAELDQVKGAPDGELPECPHCGRLIVL